MPPVFSKILPAELIHQVAAELRGPHEIYPMMLTCWAWHDVAATFLYEEVSLLVLQPIAVPSMDMPWSIVLPWTKPSSCAALLCLVRSLRSGRQYVRLIKRLSYVSWNHERDPHYIHLLLQILIAGTAIEQLRIELTNESIPIALDILGRAPGLLRCRSPPFVPWFGRHSPLTLPRLSSLRTTSVELAAALLALRPVQTLAVAGPITLPSLNLLVPPSDTTRVADIWRLSILVEDDGSQMAQMLETVAITFPNLRYLALRCQRRPFRPHLQVSTWRFELQRALTDTNLLARAGDSRRLQRVSATASAHCIQPRIPLARGYVCDRQTPGDEDARILASVPPDVRVRALHVP